MDDLFSPTMDEMIAEVDREIELRKRVFPRWVANGQLKRDVADRRIRILECVSAYLSMEKSP